MIPEISSMQPPGAEQAGMLADLEPLLGRPASDWRLEIKQCRGTEAILRWNDGRTVIKGRTRGALLDDLETG